MGEEVRITDYDISGDDDNRVSEWEDGLPTVDDLMPLSHSLVPPELASAFSITPEPHRSMMDVNRASQNTLSSLRGQSVKQNLNKFNSFKSFGDDDKGDEMMILEGGEIADVTGDGCSDSRKLRRVDSGGGGGGAVVGGGEEADSSAKMSKRPRLVWTPQLHKRFVDVVAHLGVKNAVPKTIMQLMNVEGLTRENVASHLQKYRLYLKRMQGLSNEGPSLSDQLFASTPVPQSIHESSGNGNGNGNGDGNGNGHGTGNRNGNGNGNGNGHGTGNRNGNGNGSGNGNGNGHVQITMPYPPQMMHMPYPPPPQKVGQGGAYHHGYETHAHPYNMMMQQRDWAGNKFGSLSPYQHRMTPNDK